MSGNKKNIIINIREKGRHWKPDKISIFDSWLVADKERNNETW